MKREDRAMRDPFACAARHTPKPNPNPNPNPKPKPDPDPNPDPNPNPTPLLHALIFGRSDKLVDVRTINSGFFTAVCPLTGADFCRLKHIDKGASTF